MRLLSAEQCMPVFTVTSDICVTFVHKIIPIPCKCQKIRTLDFRLVEKHTL